MIILSIYPLFEVYKIAKKKNAHHPNRPSPVDLVALRTLQQIGQQLVYNRLTADAR